jgi:glucose/arabinose dehydrogenase
MKPIALDRRRLLGLFGAVAVLASCGGSGDSKPPLPVGGDVTVQTFASGLNTPWGMAFLPDGRVLVTERGGALRLVSADGTGMSTVAVSLPSFVSAGQGGLLDVALDPDFANGENWVYLSFSQTGAGGSGTAVLRGRLDVANPDALTDATVIFQQLPRTSGSNNHYGSRLVFRGDGTLFVTLGERFEFAPAQDLNSHLGKVVRINRDGSIPADNPTFGGTPHSAGIWSYGHRNPQGAALHPSGELWVSEHGPQGGDEINIALAGRNFGWPNVSYGCHYGSVPCTPVGGGTHEPLYTEPLTHWEPSIAPSGMMFYSGTMFPEWQGNLFVGALAGTALWRLTVDSSSVTGREELLPADINVRIRDVAQGPDGGIYFIEETNGRIVRITR